LILSPARPLGILSAAFLAGVLLIGVVLFELERDSALAFSIPIRGGQVLATIGDAIDFVAGLSQERLERHYWYRAVLMLNTAVKRPQFRAAATINLHTAVAMDFLLSEHELLVPDN
jgi:hypothetical protein